uniref:Uncharacterized protein n=1 Tax=viral metagenome TaxID=1070528 RepID=A0A6C0CJ66_9ZZZZ
MTNLSDVKDIPKSFYYIDRELQHAYLKSLLIDEHFKHSLNEVVLYREIYTGKCIVVYSKYELALRFLKHRPLWSLCCKYKNGVLHKRRMCKAIVKYLETNFEEMLKI